MTLKLLTTHTQVSKLRKTFANISLTKYKIIKNSVA